MPVTKLSKGAVVMIDYCVVAVDATRARFFTLEPIKDPTRESGPHLKEQDHLENAEKMVPEREMFSSVKRGRNRGPAGQAHGYDDHRERHEKDFERRFAVKVMEQAFERRRTCGARILVLTAEPGMLGQLRQATEKLSRNGFELQEYAADFTRMSTTDIHDVLAHQNLLPPPAKLRR